MGFASSFLLVLLYHCSTALNGTNVSFGCGVICDWLSANDVTKLKKFSAIFWANSVRLATLLGVDWVTGVCCIKSSSLSTDIPICAMCVGCGANGLSVTAPKSQTESLSIIYTELNLFSIFKKLMCHHVTDVMGII